MLQLNSALLSLVFSCTHIMLFDVPAICTVWVLPTLTARAGSAQT